MISYSEQETIEFGKKLGKKLKSGDIVALYGELGAGKTVLIKGIVKGIGCDTQVKSPSFVFVHEYKGKFPVYHVDLYRVNNLKDVLSLGIQEFLKSDGICLIEWAENAKDIIPLPHIKIRLKILNENIRDISISNVGLGD
ncbi:MAG: tRNA (adenosine(37)-N6)-threonylcarbamoyltransferase complex ATPase subunit type 1 TsaE [bacterium]|nr:tRNA (adenosine(37)-N6)-threonylcarbamoyltransferase complex ATPase subunit type 1 TsaE [bacterium]